MRESWGICVLGSGVAARLVLPVRHGGTNTGLSGKGTVTPCKQGCPLHTARLAPHF